jgi:signal transduction histidine kinase
MFASVGRRLALLNAAIVVLVIAIVGATTYALLRASLDREADRALAERARAAESSWAGIFRSGQPQPAIATPNAVKEDNKGDGDHDETEDAEEGHELLESGDTLLYGFSADGALLVDSRGVPIAGLPDQAGVAAALRGEKDTRTLRLHNQTVRVYTAPVLVDGRIVGAVQAARGQAEHESELRLVGWGSLMGVGAGILIAVPAGLLLARRAMRPIDAAFARQRAFVADASHELRAPLTVIRANAELVQRLPDASPAVKEETAEILSEIDGMARLVDDLLLLARLDADALALEREPLDLAALVRAAVATMEERARTAGLSLTVESEPAVRANADPSRIRQIVRILLDNAITYTSRGGAITVTVGHHGHAATVRVTDTGIGIAPEDQERIFDRFYRTDRARSRATGGTGLGLAIARALVEAHGGHIGVESAPGRGTTVWFSLPIGHSTST